MKKICRECKISKELRGFYRHSEMLDGHLNKCISCVKKRVRKHRKMNLEKIRLYDRTRWKQPQRLKKLKEYAKSDAGVRSNIKSKAKWSKKNKEKRTAHSKLWNALSRGKITKKPCEKCGEVNADAHHDDYSRPLDVRWLCHIHHMEFHRLDREMKRNQAI